MEYIAHIRDSDGEIQTVQAHLREVNELSEQFGDTIGLKNLAGLAGLLHDLGKNTNEFKTYIQEAVANPDNPPRRGSVDHSTAGGRLLYQRYYTKQKSLEEKLAVEWIAMCIISHHGGLRDFLTPPWGSTFLERVSEKILEQYEHAVSSFFETQMTEKAFDEYFDRAKAEVVEIMHVIKSKRLQPITASLITKYIFSCLIDADRTNTRRFEENQPNEEVFDSHSFFEHCYTALMKEIVSYSKAEDANHPINLLRSEMSRQCEEFAYRPSGIYTLSIPTGGGKTLASLRYALKHAMTHGKDRIIYIVPYTTIIEQNAKDVRDIINNDPYILEHHSNVIKDDPKDEEEDYDVNKKKLKLAKDNWDSPIIFTTMVQFLNTFYAKGTRNVRRLHHLTNAIIIFDEVQSVPVKCLSLFNEALNFLHTFGNSSLILCTATQPALDFVEHDLKISANGEMIKDLNQVSESFKRVNIIDRTTTQGYKAPELTDFIHTEMDKVSSILIILNTKTAVRKLFDELDTSKRNDYTLFHLSTNMCPAHRKDVLADLKEKLEAGERVVCVSSQLIEAGVNISFQCVIRSLAGLDSIAQAAGRCNRHGKDEIRNVYIINSAEEELKNLKEIKIGAEKTKRLLGEFKDRPDKFGNDLLSLEAMSCYFKYYFHEIAGELDYHIPEIDKKMFDLLNYNKEYNGGYKNKHGYPLPLVNNQSFATAESYFNVIDQPTTSVLAPYNAEAQNLMLELNGDLDTRRLSNLLKKAQQFVINIYDQELRRLDKSGDVYPLLHGNIFALREVAYTEKFGLELGGEGSWTTPFA
ncbi:MAG: CRISPR-associated helicase Cas3' [Paenibacillaceae bacterium]